MEQQGFRIGLRDGENRPGLIENLPAESKSGKGVIDLLPSKGDDIGLEGSSLIRESQLFVLGFLSFCVGDKAASSGWASP